MTPQTLLRPFLLRQDGAVTTAQAESVGVTPRQLRTLVSQGWTRPARGVYIQPEPLDAFRARLRAAMLLCPDAVACGRSAARVHKLQGLPIWTSRELPELLLPGGKVQAQRPSARLRFTVEPVSGVNRAGVRVTCVGQTVSQLCYDLKEDDLICLLDSALRLGWSPADFPLSRARGAHISRALVWADGRSESALETYLRLLLVRADLAPEVLQLKLMRDGECFARLDMAWPSHMLAVEADGREHHDKPDALYKDRRRQNNVLLAGWLVLRFTWFDVTRRPSWVLAQVREALATRHLPKA